MPENKSDSSILSSIFLRNNKFYDITNHTCLRSGYRLNGKSERFVYLIDTNEYLLLNKGLLLFGDNYGTLLLFQEKNNNCSVISGSYKRGNTILVENKNISQLINTVIDKRALLLKNKLIVRTSRYVKKNNYAGDKTQNRLTFDLMVNTIHLSQERNIFLKFVTVESNLKDRLELPLKELCNNKLNQNHIVSGLSALIRSCQSFVRINQLYSSDIENKENKDLILVFKEIVVRLLNLIEINIDGAVSDIDIEFMHDLRVGARKLRSLIKLFGVYSGLTLTDDITVFLKMIGRKTNKQRDLDVFIVDWLDFMKTLPDDQKELSNKFIDYLKTMRNKAHRQSARFLDSIRYYLTEMADNINKTGFQNVVDRDQSQIIVNDIIGSHRSDICNKGTMLNDQSTDAEFHSLRIICKEIRYSTDYFGYLIDNEQKKEITTKGKKLQTLLGSYNDYSVQSVLAEKYFSKWLISAASDDYTKYSNLLTAFIEDTKNNKKRIRPLIFEEISGLCLGHRRF